jgi:hypothetical protein
VEGPEAPPEGAAGAADVETAGTYVLLGAEEVVFDVPAAKSQTAGPGMV